MRNKESYRTPKTANEQLEDCKEESSFMMLRLANDSDSDYSDTEDRDPSIDDRDGIGTNLRSSRLESNTDETVNSETQSEMPYWDDELSNWTSGPSERSGVIPSPERDGGRLIRAIGAINLNSSEIEQETSFINTEGESTEANSILPNCGTV